MRSKTKKSISRLVGIWTFLLLLIFKGIFSNPAYAFLSSLDACAANPECAAIVGSELSPAVSAPTAEGIGTTISTTSATEASTTVEAAAEVTVVGDMRLSGIVTYYIWNQAQNQQAQEKARQKYCAANPSDSVCGFAWYVTGHGLSTAAPWCEPNSTFYPRTLYATNISFFASLFEDSPWQNCPKDIVVLDGLLSRENFFAGGLRQLTSVNQKVFLKGRSLGKERKLSDDATFQYVKPYFITETELGKPEYSSAEDIARELQFKPPKLIFLSGCETGRCPH